MQLNSGQKVKENISLEVEKYKKLKIKLSLYIFQKW